MPKRKLKKEISEGYAVDDAVREASRSSCDFDSRAKIRAGVVSNIAKCGDKAIKRVCELSSKDIPKCIEEAKASFKADLNQRDFKINIKYREDGEGRFKEILKE